ncbi:MAG: hypothetical protein GY820_11310 [Gammaproteobacteria bacterium]|nr:hypothetical protein [Gammaproteobacteria bacterium]
MNGKTNNVRLLRREKKETEKCMVILGNDESFRLTDFGPAKKIYIYRSSNFRCCRDICHFIFCACASVRSDAYYTNSYKKKYIYMWQTVRMPKCE